ncbi:MULTISPECIES: preprotein translocase subunit SecY [Methylococcus]|jgi:preprotein translocase subunit SecY|uniref:Protein translocase subunit SecY n=1 Tax=Methylococcus capsulatus TaxID=414 RepID=A0AA35Y0R6_METCP|nr:preprotein translocase subunit SecY [Methylococcus capsulatus]QXP87070.1 preprotein translocase subunit SecY [Methylococcus capsulatus]QXP91583.1 preprotein translocase subunit SecY [Methylococcus capsulatus]QXP93250.1 preprotein translocase subunit SecY [Methylococcus capsulatus]UQN12055.1 preprotein translocase subunit SecY [Methylococcus capsulatus]CAI8836513.1 Sec translocon subunit SecY [Methylococcus capsulatus]
MNAINPLMADRGGRFTELRQRLLFVVGALIVFRIGAHIPIPGVDPKALAAMFNQQGSSILDMVNMFSGGALKRLSIFALGIMPYISASIILQLMTIVVPKLEQLKKEGESGRKKINQYTRYATVVLASFQATGVAMALQNQSAGGAPIVVSPGFQFVALTAISLVTGTMFLMWLGEQVTERGLGNGISIIIFAGIVAGLPSAVGGTLELARTGELSAFSIIGIAAIAVAVTWLVVFVEKGQRRITINYAKRQEGRRMYAAQKSFLPLKLNMSGVIPPIFASSIILFPATLAGWFGNSERLIWLQDIASTLSPGQPLYVLCYAAAIMFFCFFYAALVFNSNETAENLKKSGAFIPGIRPGQQTARYVDTVMTRLTLIGGIYITAVCLLPEFLIVYWNVPFYFGGTSLLIIVVVVMDFMAQIQTYVISQQYEGLLKKTNINIR